MAQCFGQQEQEQGRQEQCFDQQEQGTTR